MKGFALVFSVVILTIFSILLGSIIFLDSKNSQRVNSGNPTRTVEAAVITPKPTTELEENQIIFVSTYHPEATESSISEEDVLLLAQCMASEDGIDWPDDYIMAIGEVVLNRVASPLFPDTIEEVLYQEGQYAPFLDGTYVRDPDDNYIRLARRLLSGERVMNDPDVVFQALFPQGNECVLSVYDSQLGTTTYFCKN